jgi:hypothetical protein
MNRDSDDDVDVDANNYKGLYAGETKEKFIDPETGAHFEYKDLCKRIAVMKERRKAIDAKLGIVEIQ